MSSSDRGQVNLSRIRTFPLFSGLDDTMWELLKEKMSFEEFDAEEALISSGEDTNDLYWIQEGKVSVYRETPFGPQPIADLAEGSSFGELALIDGRGRSTDVTTRSKAKIWRIDGNGLLQLFQVNPTMACRFYRHFWASLAKKINLANAQMQKFFGGKQPKEEKKESSRARPSWFAPPEGIQAESSASFLGVVNSGLTEEDKRKALEEAGLAPPEISLLFKLGDEMVIPQDQAVFHEGDFGDTLYFIVHGTVRISKKIEGIGEEALALLEAGQMFGEMALVSENAVRSADCYAHEGEAILLAFRQHMLKTLQGQTDHDYPFLRALCKMMAHRLREINEKLFSWRMMSGGF